MTKFDEAFKYLLKWEGVELVNDPDDSGGTTKFGISEKWYMDEFDTLKDKAQKAIEKLTQDDAMELYHQYFWQPIFDSINKEKISNYIFDMWVNIGPSAATKCVQRACWGHTGNANIPKDDGIFGPTTLTFVNQFDILLLSIMRAERAGYYRRLVIRNPGNQKFLNGWLRRAYG